MSRFKKMADFIFECELRVMLLLSVFFFIGMAFGAYHSCGEAAGELSDVMAGEIIPLYLKNLLMLFVTFVLGYTVIGAPLICGAVIYGGVCCGLFCGLAVNLAGLAKGTLVIALFYVFYFVNVLCLLLMSFSSLRLSLALYNVFKNNTRYVSPEVYSKPHLLKFVVFSAFTFLSCAYYVFAARKIALILL